ncbi:hypothetical protein F4808DRAFT_466626 [Astrocystis sublimbata]|nr:hypothetical protein F4808DRAFT_466626 [Astrocystis sublimbata]
MRNKHDRHVSRDEPVSRLTSRRLNRHGATPEPCDPDYDDEQLLNEMEVDEDLEAGNLVSRRRAPDYPDIEIYEDGTGDEGDHGSGDGSEDQGVEHAAMDRLQTVPQPSQGRRRRHYRYSMEYEEEIERPQMEIEEDEDSDKENIDPGPEEQQDEQHQQPAVHTQQFPYDPRQFANTHQHQHVQQPVAHTQQYQQYQSPVVHAQQGQQYQQPAAYTQHHYHQQQQFMHTQQHHHDQHLVTHMQQHQHPLPSAFSSPWPQGQLPLPDFLQPAVPFIPFTGPFPHNYGLFNPPTHPSQATHYPATAWPSQPPLKVARHNVLPVPTAPQPRSILRQPSVVPSNGPRRDRRRRPQFILPADQNPNRTGGPQRLPQTPRRRNHRVRHRVPTPHPSHSIMANSQGTFRPPLAEMDIEEIPQEEPAENHESNRPTVDIVAMETLAQVVALEEAAAEGSRARSQAQSQAQYQAQNQAQHQAQYQAQHQVQNHAYPTMGSPDGQSLPSFAPYHGEGVQEVAPSQAVVQDFQTYTAMGQSGGHNLTLSSPDPEEMEQFYYDEDRQ